MPAPPSLACTTTAAPAPLAPAPPATECRGSTDLGLAPRCGARTRAGCPCRAPALHGKRRCRMHGGRSTGPRTPEGLARLRTARTSNATDAYNRAHACYIMSVCRRGRATRAIFDCLDRLPEDLVARFDQMPPELEPPHRPTVGITVAEDRAMRRADAAALAPWRRAIARARQAARRGQPKPAAAGLAGQAAAMALAAAPCGAHAKLHASPEPASGRPAASATRPASARAGHAPKPHAPVPSAAGPGAPAAPEIKPHASVRSAADPGAPAAVEIKPHAPERHAGTVPGGTTASPAGPAIPPPKPHAPAPTAEATAPSARPSGVQTKPHAPDSLAAAHPAPALSAENPEPKPHAPVAPDDPASPTGKRDGGETPPSPNRHARRWHRKWQRLQQKRTAAPRP